MSDLVEFLLARIAEDEGVARLAGELAEAPWRATYGRQVETPRDGYLVTPEDEYSRRTDPPDEVGIHVARHDPARIQAECEAKRRIVELSWHHLGEDDYGWGMEEAKRQILLLLALPYAHHPDYDDTWRP